MNIFLSSVLIKDSGCWLDMLRGGLMLMLVLSLGPVWAQREHQPAQEAASSASVPDGIFIGRLQVAQHTDHVVRLSESTYSANAQGLFFLQALDHHIDTDSGRPLLTRWQAYYGGPLPLNYTKNILGWVGRLEAVHADPNLRLADARWGLQINFNRISALNDWFRESQVDLFVQIFPLRTNRDFGTLDTFTRFSKRFSPKVVARGYVRTFRIDGSTVAVFENDLIYEVQRDFDVLLRVGKGSNDVAGLSDKRWMAGVGMRFNF